MSKQTQRPPQGKPNPNGNIGRSEQQYDDDRPFAEIRRTLHDALRLLSLHRWMFFVPFCLVTCAAFVVSLYYPRTYSATTSFELRNDPVMINLPMSAGAASFKYFRNTMVRDLTAFECLSEVLEELKLPKDAERNEDGALTPDSQRRRDALARSLGASLNVSLTSPSELVDIVKIAYTGPDAGIGRDLVDQLKRTYMRRTMTWIHQFLVRQRDYFRREAEEIGAEVQRAEREETRLRLENPHVNPTDPGAISARLAQLESERRELRLRKREYETELEGFRQLVAAQQHLAGPAAGDNDLATAESEYSSVEALHLASQIQDVQAKVLNLRDTRGMTDAHPEIQALLASRAHLDAKLSEQRERDHRDALTGQTTPHPVSSAVALASPLQGERARLMVQIAAQNTKIKDVDISLQTNELALADITKAKDGVYEKQEEFGEVLGSVHKAKQRLAQAESTLATIEPAIKAVEQDRLLQFSEGQPARGGATPVSPKALTVVLLSLLVGVAAGVLCVVLAEILDHVFRSSAQVGRSLGLPILEAIDEIVTGQDRRRFLVHHAVVTPIVVLFCVGIAGLTGSMAYLSLTQPWTYQRIRNIPETALSFFIETTPQAPPHDADAPDPEP